MKSELSIQYFKNILLSKIEECEIIKIKEIIIYYFYFYIIDFNNFK